MVNRLGAAISTMAILAMVVTGCSGDDAEPLAPPASQATSDGAPPADTPSPEPADVHPLVGEWAQELRCDEMVSALEGVGMNTVIKDAVWGSFFWPEPETIQDFRFEPSDPCRGARPRLHSHFFTEDGSFGSLDEHGQQVDDGRYYLRGDDTIVINGSTFRYRIDGDSVMFEPRLPECTDCFEAMWMIAVASPERAWDRVD